MKQTGLKFEPTIIWSQFGISKCSPFALLEFGAILVCPKKLVELDFYSTLICPNHLSRISAKSERCNGISRAAVSTAPPFADVADKVFQLLDGIY